MLCDEPELEYEGANEDEEEEDQDEEANEEEYQDEDEDEQLCGLPEIETDPVVLSVEAGLLCCRPSILALF
jgi:hypothetical protein